MLFNSNELHAASANVPFLSIALFRRQTWRTSSENFIWRKDDTKSRPCVTRLMTCRETEARNSSNNYFRRGRAPSSDLAWFGFVRGTSFFNPLSERQRWPFSAAPLSRSRPLAAKISRTRPFSVPRANNERGGRVLPLRDGCVGGV